MSEFTTVKNKKLDGFTIIPNLLFHLPEITHADFVLYAWYRCVCRTEEGACWMSIETICKRCRMDRRTVIASRTRLENLGLIESSRVTKTDGSTKITVTLTPIWERNDKVCEENIADKTTTRLPQDDESGDKTTTGVVAKLQLGSAQNYNSSNNNNCMNNSNSEKNTHSAGPQRDASERECSFPSNGNANTQKQDNDAKVSEPILTEQQSVSAAKVSKPTSTKQSRDGGLLPQVPPAATKPNKSRELAVYLHDALAKRRRIMVRANIGEWSEALRKFMLKSDLKPGEFEKVLRWYADHIDEEFVPVAYCAVSFCSKFSSICRARERATGEWPKLDAPPGPEKPRPTVILLDESDEAQGHVSEMLCQMDDYSEAEFVDDTQDQ